LVWHSCQRVSDSAAISLHVNLLLDLMEKDFTESAVHNDTANREQDK